MPRRTLTCFACALQMLVCVVPAYAQRLSVSVDVPGAAKTGTLSYRVFSERPELRVRFIGSHRATCWMLAHARSGALAFTTSSGTVLPVETDWEQTIHLPDGNSGPTMLDQPMLLEPGASAEWALRIRRADRQVFAAGDYRLSIAFESRCSTPLAAQPQPMMAAAIGVTLAVQPAESPADVALMHRSAAFKALEGSDNAAALEAFLSALEADPGDDQSRVGAGNLLVARGEYEEAVEHLERLATPPADPRSAGFSALIQAYIGTGRPERAVEFMRSTGMPEAGVLSALDQAERFVRERAKQ